MRLQSSIKELECDFNRSGALAGRVRGTGLAGPQEQRPLEGQRGTRSDKRGGLIPAYDIKSTLAEATLHKLAISAVWPVIVKSARHRARRATNCRAYGT